jgi:hypothetical protein
VSLLLPQQTVLEEMPAYPERESSAWTKMRARDQFVTDKTWKDAKHTRKDKRTSLAGAQGQADGQGM